MDIVKKNTKRYNLILTIGIRINMLTLVPLHISPRTKWYLFIKEQCSCRNIYVGSCYYKFFQKSLFPGTLKRDGGQGGMRLGSGWNLKSIYLMEWAENNKIHLSCEILKRGEHG